MPETPVVDDVELLVTFLSGPVRRRRVLAENVLAAAGNLWALGRLSPLSLRRLGLPYQAAARVRAAFLLGTRGAWPPAASTRLLGPTESFRYLAPHFLGCVRERFLSVAVDVKSRPIVLTVVAEGSADSCPVDLREVFRAAIAEGATAVLVAHNHPSGDPTPSAEDLALTERLIEAAAILGLQVLDHVIVARPLGPGEHGDYVSLVASGMWPGRRAPRRTPGKGFG
jgi:DNA repair protein RadC